MVRDVDNIFLAKWEVSRLGAYRGFSNPEKLVNTYLRTGLSVYPHQVYAALAAMVDPLRRGFVLGCECGLGKGVTSMIVASQHYYDAKKICVVVPSPLLEMWRDLIVNKFDLPLEGDEAVTLVSYSQAVERAAELKAAKFII